MTPIFLSLAHTSPWAPDLYVQLLAQCLHLGAK